MDVHEIVFGFELQRRIRSAETRNPRMSEAEASFGCDYPCGCYRVFSVNKESVEVTHRRHQDCNGKCLPALLK